MAGLNRDTLIAIFLLLVCGGLYWASLGIREPDYGTLSPSTWPRIILGIFGFLSAIYLVQSLRQGPDQPDESAPEVEPGLVGFVKHWSNVLWVFALFLAYLLTLPWIGMLIGGMVFVFCLLTALGNWSGRDAVLHAAIALITVGGTWLIFTYGLGVLLPRGELTGI